MATTATVKHLHIKRGRSREVIFFYFTQQLLWEAKLHITPLRASDILQEPVFLFFVVVVLFPLIVSQQRRFQTVIDDCGKYNFW